MSNIDRDGGHILVDQLLIQGVEMAFCVPGESFLPAINALRDVKDRIQLVVCRQEGGAAYMADAYGKLKRKPGVCFVTRGPGASNAAIGIHTAFQDSTPLVLFVGQVGTNFIDREAFQEVDFNRMFGGMAKWVAQINTIDRIPEYVTRAFQISVSGRPGPVILALPENILSDSGMVSDGAKYKKVKASPSESSLNDLAKVLTESKKPIILVGGSDWSDLARSHIKLYAERLGIPLVCSFRRQDLIDNNHPCYCGDVGIGINPMLQKNLIASDLIIALGPRLGEMTTGGYELFRQSKNPEQKLVHIHQGAEELGSVFAADLCINAGMEEFTSALVEKDIVQPVSSWAIWAKEMRSDYLDTLKLPKRERDSNYADLGVFIDRLKSKVPANSIITNGAGNYTGWVQRYWQYVGFGTQLAPTSGAMGYGVPSGVAAGLVYPDQQVISFSGDGCFLMNGQELATAMQYNVKVLFVVVNNGMYGTIRLHQEKSYPGRVYGTELSNPDFCMLARSFGLHSELVSVDSDIDGALERALSVDSSSLIEIKVDPDNITTRLSLPI